MKKSAFYSLILVLTTSTLLSACRFGNHSEQAQPLPNRELYKSVEFFFTTPKSFETRAYLNSLSGPDAVVNINSKAPMASIPSNILSTFSDPVYFVIPNDPAESPFFRNYNTDNRIYTTLDASGKIAEDYDPGTFVLWSDPDCLTQFEIIHEGDFDRSNPGSIQYPDGTVASVAGSLNLSYTFSRVIQSVNGEDHCTADLTRLANCYTDGTGCSSNELSGARALFDLYVKQTGVLKIEDAAKIKALEYIIHFE